MPDAAHRGELPYRPDIDGLRALAVVPVILFHAGFATFGGGFVGVDVFFVISGFLITTILDREMRAGTFSVARFYERRARRILPALLLVVAASLLMGVAVQLPADLVDQARVALAVEAFASNILFWREAGYFSSAAALSPLLHTWSLAVEEQYYVLFPPLLLLCARGSPGRLRLAVLAIGALSFLLSLYLVPRRPAMAFYLLPTRAWELMAGAVLALGMVPTLPTSRIAATCSVAGIGAILWAVFAYSETTPFPGLAAALPVAGAVLLIHAGSSFAAANRILAAPPLVAVGRISYSLYLWHVPVLVGVRHLVGATSLPVPARIVAVGVSLALAALSYRYVEQPLRDRTRFGLGRLVAMLGGAGLAVAAASGAIIALHGFPARFSPQALAFAADADGYPKEARACLKRTVGEAARLPACRIGPGRPRFVLWGDSMAGALSPAIADLAGRAGASGVMLIGSSCPPIARPRFGMLALEDQAACERHSRDALAFALRPGLDTVFLFGDWKGYDAIDGTRLTHGLRATVARLKAAGKRVVVVKDLPYPGTRPPWRLAIGADRGWPLPSSVEERSPPGFDRAVAGAETVSLGALLCRSGRCPLAAGGRAIFKDEIHLSQYGSERVIGPQLPVALLRRPPAR